MNYLSHDLRSQCARRKHSSGFALVATIPVMVLIVLVALALVSLSTLELRDAQTSKHQEEAKANARLALMQAMNELQIHTGPDQRVTARAAILEDGNTSANRNWLGVWKTTVEAGGQDWPVIGKAADGNSNAPYSRSGAYVDLRHTQSNLADGAWKSELRQAWLVSKKDHSIDPTQALSDSDDDVVEIIGRGTLGNNLSNLDFDNERVLVQKVNVGDTGAYAWHVADNSQKASIDPIGEIEEVEVALEASPRNNPALVQLSDGSDSYKSFSEDALDHVGKLITYETSALTQSDTDKMKDALKEKYNDFTAYSPGLFVDTMMGGLRKDLTPLLLADKSETIIDFSDSSGAITRNFSSSYPIIPGPDHGVLGPSFGALRDWALNSYETGNDAQTTAPSSAIRMRPTTHWPHNISDGATMDASEWAESAPKIHPVMTEARWHYYFSHNSNRIRTHIIPRVCLWNPYNKDLNVSELTVMMANPFFATGSWMHFFVENAHVQELQAEDPDFGSWSTRNHDDYGAIYKMRVNPFPATRFLAFTLEPTTIAAGECHVFSPKVTSASLVASGIELQEYDPDNVSTNVLSSSSPQGTEHFYYDHEASVNYQMRTSKWANLDKLIDKIDFTRIYDYHPETSTSAAGNVPNFPFVLKSGNAASMANLLSGTNHPTLQLINNGAGGAHATSSFSKIGELWGSANQQDLSFGNLQTFAEAPLKDAPDTHQVGVKMLWLDESATEANNPPLRHGTSSTTRWVPEHMALNPCPVANWNLRAQLQTRSPVSQCGERYYLNSLGAWLLQFVPLSPQEFNDQPNLNSDGTAFVKNPFGAATNYSFNPRVVLFDLPSSDYGVLSMAKLRHAMLSPYSWVPTYLVGHSLRDLHAPSESTAHEIATGEYTESFPATRWDSLLGADNSLGYGAETANVNSEGLLQIGSEAVTRTVNGETLSSEEEILAYDIAYEVNHNLWDSYFISGMPVSNGTSSFNWDPLDDKPLWNRRYQFNFDGIKTLGDAVVESSSGGAAQNAFWENAAILKNRAAFNVNSTSVDAWVAFLSGSLGIERPTESGALDGEMVSFARHRNPFFASDTDDADPDSVGGWSGARELSDQEVRTLAENIVQEVQRRGPFVSIADFVNRRLTNDQKDESMIGTLDAAIKVSELNAGFEANPDHLSTTVDSGSDNRSEDNNHDDFREGYRFQKDGEIITVQPASKAWGMPGYLTQGDVLESIAPALTVRGDTFTIRAYGESTENGVVKARAWVEAVVERTPNYVDSSENGNNALESATFIDYASGDYSDGGLTETNKKFGRKFVIKSLRWLGRDEI